MVSIHKNRGAGALVRTFLIVGAMQFAALPLTLLTSIALARILGASDFGMFAFAISLAGMLSLPVGPAFGLIVTREAARAAEDNNFGLVKGLTRRCRQMLWAYSLIILLGVVIAYFGFGLGSVTVLTAVVLSPLLARIDLDGAFMRAFHHPALSRLCSMLLRPIAVLVVSLVIWWVGGLNLRGALIAQIVASTAILVVSSVLLRRTLPNEMSEASATYADRAWMKSYPPFLLISSMNFFSISIGIVWLGLIGDTEGASGMRVGQSAGQLVQLALVAVNLVVQPQLAQRGSGLSDQQAVIQPFVHGARLAFFGSLLIGLPLLVFAGPLIHLVYSEEFVPLAATATQMVVLGQIINAAAGPSGMLLAMSGNERLAFRSQLAGLIFTLVFVISLSPAFGATGAALGIAAGLAVKNGFEVIYLRRIYNRWLFAFSRLP